MKCTSGAKEIVHWQMVSTHVDLRMFILKRIYKLISNRYIERKSCEISKLIEKAIFMKAHSVHEYSDLSTLPARIRQALLVAYQTSKRKCHFNRTNLNFCKKYNSKIQYPINSTNSGNYVHKKISMSEPVLCKKNKDITTARTEIQEESKFFCNNQQDLIHTIYSYLSFPDLAKSRRINRFGHRILPRWVDRITLTSKNFCTLLQQSSILHFFQSYSNVKEFIVEQAHPKVPIFGDGEIAVCNLAFILEKRLMPHLRRLEIASTFINTKHFNALGKLVTCFEHGACPELAVLNLAANCIGDYGAVRIAQLVQSGICQNLNVVHLQSNFIGEKGALALASCIRSGSDGCTTLKLEGNSFSQHCLDRVNDDDFSPYGNPTLANTH